MPAQTFPSSVLRVLLDDVLKVFRLRVSAIRAHGFRCLSCCSYDFLDAAIDPEGVQRVSLREESISRILVSGPYRSDSEFVTGRRAQSLGGCPRHLSKGDATDRLPSHLAPAKRRRSERLLLFAPFAVELLLAREGISCGTTTRV